MVLAAQRSGVSACEGAEWGTCGAGPPPPLALEGKGLWGLTLPLESGLFRGPAVAKIRAGQATKSPPGRCYTFVLPLGAAWPGSQGRGRKG